MLKAGLSEGASVRNPRLCDNPSSYPTPPRTGESRSLDHARRGCRYRTLAYDAKGGETRAEEPWLGFCAPPGREESGQLRKRMGPFY
jgi:hypothetical protein